MKDKRYRPAIGKMFWFTWIPLTIILAAIVIISMEYPVGLILTIGVSLFCYYFLVSSLVAYVELREESLFIKFGFVFKKEIPYKNIRELVKVRRFYTESFLAIKNTLEHVNIKYKKFDIVSVSVKNNDEFIKEVEKLVSSAKNR